MSPPTLPGDAARFSLAVPGRAEISQIVIARGLLDHLPPLLARHAPAPLYAVMADSHVAGPYGERVVGALESAGRPAALLTFPAGEASKSPSTWGRLVEELGRLGMGRDGCVLAVGGGVTGDLAGFAAATFARGVAFVQVPTSLLAMIDASIGGKTGVDLAAGKNLAGAFHHPRLVACDPDVLATLPPADLRTGLAEAVKHGAVADAGYLERLVREAEEVVRADRAAIDWVVRDSVRIKAAIVARDALEAGERAVLNFGHTIGHAVELLTELRVPHGHAVAMGMVAEAWIGERLELTEPGTADRVRKAVSALGLPSSLPEELDPERVVDVTRGDKKARGGAPRYALIRAIGEPARAPDGRWTLPVPDEVVLPALRSWSGA